MRKIALLADSWKRIVTSDWISGMETYFNNMDENIVLCHFNSMGNWSNDTTYNKGEYNIFRLQDLSEFDGIILDVNCIREEKQLKNTLELVRKSKVPAISLGHFVEDMYYIGVDNEGAIKEIMDHLHYMHNCQSFYYVGGPEISDENRARAKSFMSCIEDWGLNPDDNRIFYGNFEMVSGENFFKRFMEEKMPMPDAFVCANDNIAAGLIDAAQRYGYKVPRDFLVTGFDNTDKAYCFEPQITSVAHKRVLMGEECLKIFRKLWNNEEVEKRHYLPAEVTFTESCGCPLADEIDFRNYVKKSIVTMENQRVFENKLIDLQVKLERAQTFGDIYRLVGKYFSELDCNGLTLVMDRRVEALAEEDVFPVSGYEKDQLEVVYSEGIENKLSYISYEEIVNRAKESSTSDVYMFTPIHLRDRSIGFTIVRNAHFLYDNPHFYDIQSLLTDSILQMYQKNRLKESNRKLNELYRRDALTGLYNRMAYFNTVEPVIDNCRKCKKVCLISFFDCDDFKKINDEQGHDAGDRILQKIGQILKTSCTKNGCAFRFGGDEFVLVNPCDNEKEARELNASIEKEFEAAGISISVGMVVTDDDRSKKLQDYINIADKCMYENKRLKKSSR